MLEPWVYEWVKERQGSISAEHGLGLAKKDYITYSRSENMVGLMKQIKGLYDPVSSELCCGCAGMVVADQYVAERHHEPVQVHLDGSTPKRWDLTALEERHAK